MENGKLKIIIGIIITLAVGGLAFLIYDRLSNTVTDSMETISDFGTTVETQDYVNLDGRTDVPGSDVQTFLQNHKGDNTYILIKTSKNKSGEYYNYSGTDTSEANMLDAATNNKRISKTKTKTSNTYVNPSGTFTCAVDYGTDDTSITGIEFTQN